MWPRALATGPFLIERNEGCADCGEDFIGCLTQPSEELVEERVCLLRPHTGTVKPPG
jgi:hypothetical protein